MLRLKQVLVNHDNIYILAMLLMLASANQADDGRWIVAIPLFVLGWVCAYIPIRMYHQLRRDLEMRAHMRTAGAYNEVEKQQKGLRY